MPTDPELLRKLFKVAKTRETNFAFGLGSGPEDSVLVLDLKRDGKRLFSEIRKENPEIKKGTWGTTEPGPKSTIMRCEKPLTILEKLMPKLLKLHRISAKVEVLGPRDEA